MVAEVGNRPTARRHQRGIHQHVHACKHPCMHIQYTYPSGAIGEGPLIELRIGQPHPGLRGDDGGHPPQELRHLSYRCSVMWFVSDDFKIKRGGGRDMSGIPPIDRKRPPFYLLAQRRLRHAHRLILLPFPFLSLFLQLLGQRHGLPDEELQNGHVGHPGLPLLLRLLLWGLCRGFVEEEICVLCEYT